MIAKECTRDEEDGGAIVDVQAVATAFDFAALQHCMGSRSRDNDAALVGGQADVDGFVFAGMGAMVISVTRDAS